MIGDSLMAKGPENKWRDNQLRPILDKLPLYYFIKEAASIKELPDIIGITKGGRFFALEVKKDLSELNCHRTPLQRYILNKIKDLGGFAEFVYPENLNEVIHALVASSFSGDEALSLLHSLYACSLVTPLQTAVLPKKQ